MKNGTVNRAASKRSKTPPCPGIIDPESFTPAFLLNKDSSKSPKPEQGPMNSAEMTQNHKFSGSIIDPIRNPPRIDIAIPPIVPSHVLFGDMRSINLVLPKNFPNKKAKVSLVQIRMNIPTKLGKVFISS